MGILLILLFSPGDLSSKFYAFSLLHLLAKATILILNFGFILGLGGTPSRDEGLPLALYSEIAACRLNRPYEMPGIEHRTLRESLHARQMLPPYYCSVLIFCLFEHGCYDKVKEQFSVIAFWNLSSFSELPPLRLLNCENKNNNRYLCG